jgi:hypothetical protein
MFGRGWTAVAREPHARAVRNFIEGDGRCQRNGDQRERRQREGRQRHRKQVGAPVRGLEKGHWWAVPVISKALGLGMSADAARKIACATQREHSSRRPVVLNSVIFIVSLLAGHWLFRRDRIGQGLLHGGRALQRGDPQLAVAGLGRRIDHHRDSAGCVGRG